MPFDRLISNFLSSLGLFDENEPADVIINHRIVCNYRKWPLVTAIFSRVSGAWATNARVTMGPIQSVILYVDDGEVRWEFEDTCADIVNQIQIHEAKTRWVYFPIGIQFPDLTMAPDVETNDDATPGHLTMLIVDTVRRTYSLFDPDDGDTTIKDERQPTKQRHINLYGVFWVDHNKDLIPGYWCVDQRQEGGGSSLQYIVDTTDESMKHEFDSYIQEVPGGLCAILTALVSVCCLRFQCGDPWVVADGIKRIFTAMNEADREKFRVNITTWYMDIYRAKTWRDVAELMGVCNVTRSKGPCGVLVGFDGNHCTSPPCFRNTLCKQHYHELMMQSLEHHHDIACFVTHRVLDLCGVFL